MGLKSLLFSVLLIVIFSATLLILLPGIPPHIEPTSFEIKPPRKIGGWFVTNSILDEAELYLESPGIESLAVHSGDKIFTGDYTGTILEVVGKQVTKNVTTLKYPCEMNPYIDVARKSTCGWPLGMRFYKEQLYFMDYFGGLTKVNIKTGEYENLVPKSRPINGKFAHIPEDLDIAKDGTVYWADGGTNGNFFLEIISEPSGRLIKYDPQTRKNEVLLENLYFSNGVCLSDDDEFVLVAESGSSKITRYYLSGEKKGQSDTFVDGLPGYPDNIRSNGRGGFYVGIFAPWNDDYSMKLHLLSSRPMLKKLILRSRHILLSILNYAKTFLPNNPYIQIFQEYVEENQPILNLRNLPKTAMVVELSKKGEIIGVLNGKKGQISGISHISVGKQYAFLASPFEGKIWRIKLNVLRRMH